MMESDISSREAEVRILRQDVDALSFQAAARDEEHKTEVQNVSAQLEEARKAVVSLLNGGKRHLASGGHTSTLITCGVVFNAGQIK